MTNPVYQDFMAPPPPAAGRTPPTPAALLERAALSLTDLGNARRLVRAFSGQMLHVPGKGWAVADGTRFSFRNGSDRALGMAARLADLVREEAAVVAQHLRVDDMAAAKALDREIKSARPRFHTLEDARRAVVADRRAELRKWALKCEGRARILSALELARPDMAADIEDLDSDPWSLTVPNGRVDLRAAVDADLSGLEPAEAAAERGRWLLPQDWTTSPTKCAGVRYDPAADCPAWRAFLELIQPDLAMRDFLQRCMGLLVFGRNEAQACLLLRGGGGNGKSTLTDTIQHVLGERDGYAVAVKVDMFLVTRDSNPSSATPEEVDLPGARGMFASEPAATDTFSAKKIKALTGGDRRPARGLNKDQFFYYPRAVPVISFNRTPKIKDEDEGTRRRLVFLPFDVELHKLPEALRRKPHDVLADLRAEGPGILNWLIDGFRAWRAMGMAPPDAAEALKAHLMEGADPVGNFLAACTVRQVDRRVSVTELHKAFLAWCEETGAAPWSARAFGEILTEKGLRKVKASTYFWQGVAFLDDDFTDQVRRREAPPPPDDPAPF